MQSNYPKTKAAGVFNILSALTCILAIGVIAYLLFTENFRIVEEGAENGLENLGLIVIIPFTFIHLIVLFIGFLIQLIRGIRLKSASEDGDIGLASYIVTLIFKILCLAVYVFTILLFTDVKVGGTLCIIVTAIASIFTLFTMIFEFATKGEVLYEDE